jgi:general secretion pathway protein D
MTFPRYFYPLLLAALAAPLTAQQPTAAQPDAGIQLQFPNNGISDILGIYELLTGKPVIRDSGIFDGKPLSLVTAKPVTEAEAIELIESCLQLNGYVIAQSPDQTSTRVSLASSAQANLARDLPVHRSPESLPEGHALASYFIPLEHIDPSEASTTIWSHIGLHTYGRLTPVASPPGILITESADSIRQAIRVAEVLDAPQARTKLVTEFYPLKYADAVVVAQMLTSTLTARIVIPPVTIDTLGDNESRPTNRIPTQIPPRVVADDRLNRIMLVATEADHEFARKVIDQFDQPIKEQAPLERRLRYVFVDQVLPVLADILQDTGTGSSTAAAGEAVRSRRTPVASADPATLAGRPRRVSAQRDGANTAPAGYEDQLIPPEETAPPLSVLVGKTRLVADVQANKLLAYGPPEDLAKVSNLLDRLDHKPPQVYLATIIGQLTLGDDVDFGVSYLRRLSEEGNLGGGFITAENLGRAVADIRNPALDLPLRPFAPGLNLYGEIGEGVDAFIHALEQTQRFKVLSRPSIYAANNKKAVITSGRRIPVPTSSVSDLANNNSVRTAIDFQDVVLKLEVIPLINSSKEVSLNIAQVNDTVVGEQMVAENSVPVIATERLLTAVTVPNRSTIVLGGLITENEEKITSGIPLISRIPVLGHAFKSTTSRKARKELIIFIQPVVVEDNPEALAASFTEDARTEVGADAAAVFPEVPLPAFERPLPAAAPAPSQGKASRSLPRR